MVDTTEFSEGHYITADLVKKSPTKTCVIIDEAKPKETEYGQVLHVEVQLDEKTKTWRMNRDSVKNMQSISKDSKLWIGKKVQLTTFSQKGKEIVLGIPLSEVLEQ